MAVVPSNRLDMVQFFETHNPVWASNAAAIGLSLPQISALAALVNAARTDYDEQQAAIQAKLAATNAFHDSSDALRSYGADLVKVIKAYAESNDNPNVYNIAQIPAPQPPSPAGPPDQPTDVLASFIYPFGIRLTWKGSVAQGAYFGVFRRLPGESTYTFVHTTKDKYFDDTALPAGSSSVEYYIAAFRDQYQVNSTAIELQFGPDGATSTTTLGLAA